MNVIDRLGRDGFLRWTAIATVWFANFLCAITWVFFRDLVLLLASALLFGLAVFLFWVASKVTRRK